MGAFTGKGVGKKGSFKPGLVKGAARSLAVGVLAVAMAACSTGGPSVDANVTLSQALADYYAGNLTKAQAEFRAVVKKDPSNKYGWYNLGVIAQTAGKTADAGTNYDKTLALDPGFESALYNYGVLRYQAGDYPKAIDLLGKAVVANASDANAHWDLGLALAHTHTAADNLRSKNELNKGLRLDPSLIKTLGINPAKGGTGAGGGSGAKGKIKAVTTTSKAGA